MLSRHSELVNLYAGRGLITGTGTNTAAPSPPIAIAKIGFGKRIMVKLTGAILTGTILVN